MKKVGLFIATAVMLVLFAFSASAEEEGYYTYEVSNGEATITNVDSSIRGNVTIPSTLGGYKVTFILDLAFENCGSITSVIIPDSVTHIGYFAFSGCENLESVTIGSMTSIDDCAFCDCPRLESITIPDSVTNISADAFDGTAYYNNTSNWKNGVLYIGNHLIKAKETLSFCNINNGTKTISGGAFNDCDNLTSVTIPDSVTNIGSSAFSGCKSLTSVTIPDSVTSIGGYAFKDCSSLTSITIPDNVTSIGYCAFSGTAYYDNTSNWENGVLYIGNHLIQAKETLSFCNINNGTNTISDYAFSGCKSLTSITIPDNVTNIGYCAFSGCQSLTSVTIGDSVTIISDYAFRDCSSLTNITLPESVTSIGDSTFNGCKSLTSITIPDNVTSIGGAAFYKCSSLTSVTIPDSITSIGSSTFNGCKSLTSVTIPDSVTSIGGYAFKDCSSLTSITIGDRVTTIGDHAFYYCTSLHSITIPDSVTSIGNYAFENCSNLTNVTIGDRVTTIGDHAFYYCTSLQSITIPDSVTSIGQYAFQDCTGLKHLKIPASFEITSRLTFDGIDGLEEIVISKGNGIMTSYDAITYKYTPWYKSNQSLKKLIIEDGVTTIGDYAFRDCSSLTNITLPESVTSIGSSAFSGCENLESISIGDNVTSIDEFAFHGCSSLKDVYYLGTKSQWRTITIKQYNYALTNAKIHYTHKIVCIAQQDPTCTKIGYTAGEQCSDCKKWISGHETIAKLGHSYSSSYTTDKKATLSANGSKSRHCTRDGCTAKTGSTAIPKVSSFTLSTTNYVYNGKNKTPKVTVKDSKGNQLVKNVDYKTSVASSRSNIGKYYVKVTLMGNYSGTKNVYFYIRPGVPTKLTATQSTSYVKLTWDKAAGAAGYSVYRYDKSTASYKKLKSTTALSYTDKNLEAGTKYTYKVIPYGRSKANNVYYSKSNITIETATRTQTPILSDYTVYKGKVKLFWTSTIGETGYQVYYSTKKDSGFKKYSNFASNTGYINNLTSGKTYYFKVRTYIKTNSGYVYSDWSNIKGIKVK